MTYKKQNASSGGSWFFRSLWSATPVADQSSIDPPKPIYNDVILPSVRFIDITPGGPSSVSLEQYVIEDYITPVKSPRVKPQDNIDSEFEDIACSDSESDSERGSDLSTSGSIYGLSAEPAQLQSDDENYGFHLVAGNEDELNNFTVVKDPDKSIPKQIKFGMPPKNRHHTRYTQTFFHSSSAGVKPVPTKSAHEVQVKTKKKVVSGQVNFTKTVYNKLVIKGKELMAPLEAAANEFFKFLAPDCVSHSYAVCDDTGQYVSIISNAIEGYEAFAQKPVTESDLNDKKNIQRLAEIIVGSYIFGEDDLHRGNAGLKARIDFDMMFWMLFYRVKGKRWGVDGVTRDPRTAFQYSADDIKAIPVMNDNGCYYAPGKSGWASNAFSAEEVAVFAKLTEDPLFIYHKFKIMLKFLLTMDKVISRQLASLHIPQQATINFDGEKRNAITSLVKLNRARREELYDILIDMEDFRHFMKYDGEKALTEIKAELEQHNEKIKCKIANGKTYYQESLVNMENVEQECNRLLSDLDKRKIKELDLDADDPLMQSISNTRSAMRC